jgi:hypothetical protein
LAAAAFSGGSHSDKSDAGYFVVSMPLNAPRIFRMGFMGMSAILPSYSMMHTFSPARIPSDLRTASGMTT